MNNVSYQTVRRGELYWLDWSPGRGSEQTGMRPGLVVQENPASANPNYHLTIVVAVSTKGREVPSHVFVVPTKQNGLASESYIKCEQIQTVSKDRLDRFIGELDPEDLEKVDEALSRVLHLN